MGARAMTPAAERLLAAIWGLDLDPPDAGLIAEKILAADPRLAGDIDGGAALRLLREARPEAQWLSIEWSDIGCAMTLPSDFSEDITGYGPTIADAADACREALR